MTCLASRYAMERGRERGGRDRGEGERGEGGRGRERGMGW